MGKLRVVGVRCASYMSVKPAYHMHANKFHIISYAYENCILCACQTHAYHMHAKLKVFVFILRAVCAHFRGTGLGGHVVRV